MIRIEAPSQSPRHRLLGGWRDVNEDIRSLCRALAEIPEECACGDGDAHLNGHCPCCGSVAEHRVPACRTCNEQLERLRPAIDTLTVDQSRFLPVVKELFGHDDPDSAARIRAIEREAVNVRATFQRLLMAAAAFRKDCRLRHVRALKDAAGELLAQAAELDPLLDPPRTPSY